jgi:hypothetical protein
VNTEQERRPSRERGTGFPDANCNSESPPGAIHATRTGAGCQRSSDTQGQARRAREHQRDRAKASCPPSAQSGRGGGREGRCGEEQEQSAERGSQASQRRRRVATTRLLCGCLKRGSVWCNGQTKSRSLAADSGVTAQRLLRRSLLQGCCYPQLYVITLRSLPHVVRPAACPCKYI